MDEQTKAVLARRFSGAAGTHKGKREQTEAEAIEEQVDEETPMQAYARRLDEAFTQLERDGKARRRKS